MVADRISTLSPAPEGHLADHDLQQVQLSRRSLMGLAVTATLPLVAGPTSAVADPPVAEVDRLPPAYGLGQPVVAQPYGQPSQHQLGLPRHTLPG